MDGCKTQVNVEAWLPHGRDSPGNIHDALRPLGMVHKVGWVLSLPGQAVPELQTLLLTAALKVAL